MYYVSAMRSDALVHAPSSPVKRIHLVGRCTGQRLGDAPIVHTIAPPALLAAHPVLPHCSSSAQGYSAAQCPSPPLRPARCATRLRHRTPLRGMQGNVSAAIFALAPHLLAPPQKGRTPADANRGEQSLPCVARQGRICQRFGMTLVRTAHPPAMEPRWAHSAQPQVPGTTAGTVTAARVHHTPTGTAMGEERVRWHGVDRPQRGADLMLETTACGNDDIPMARVPSGCIEVVEQCFVKLPRDSSVIRPYQTSTRRRRQETVWWVKSVAGTSSIGGDRYGEATGKELWTGGCRGGSQEIQTRGEPNYRAHEESAVNNYLGGYSTSEGIYKAIGPQIRGQYCATEAGSIHKCVGIGVSGRKQTSAQGRRSSTQAAGIEREGGGERAAGGAGAERRGESGQRIVRAPSVGGGQRTAQGRGQRTARGGERRTAGARVASTSTGGGQRTARRRVQRARARGPGGERRGRAGSEWRQRTARGANGERRRAEQRTTRGRMQRARAWWPGAERRGGAGSEWRGHRVREAGSKRRAGAGGGQRTVQWRVQRARARGAGSERRRRAGREVYE
ncbi:hypothetical protein B0H14DRAFT_2632906 [Mycena olivaceomarginata]|nr:hypothetical protein B0H14DRAFT_2632906 [Mycena olivaceomarginata]